MRHILSVLTCIYIVVVGCFRCYSAPSANQYLYWNEVIPGGAQGGSAAAIEIKRSAIDGTSIQRLASTEQDGLRSVSTIAHDPIANKIYWTDPGRGFIQRAELDGSAIETVLAVTISGQHGVVGGLEIDASSASMYWVEERRETITRADLDGTNAVNLMTDVNSDRLAVDHSIAQLFVGIHGEGVGPEGPRDKIDRANLDGTERRTIIERIVQLTEIDIDPLAQKLYWVDVGFNALNDTAIRRANYDGSSVETLLVNLADVIIDIDVVPQRNAIFWTSRDQGTIKRSDLNGGNVQTLLTGLSQPHAILVIPEPNSATLIALGGLLMTAGRRRFRQVKDRRHAAPLRNPPAGSNS